MYEKRKKFLMLPDDYANLMKRWCVMCQREMRLARWVKAVNRVLFAVVTADHLCLVIQEVDETVKVWFPLNPRWCKKDFIWQNCFTAAR